LFAFGGANDFRIYDECHKNDHSFSDFGNDYELPDGIRYSYPEAKEYLAGAYKFRVLEIEVYQLFE
jgi:hypothetical protein